MIHLFLLCTAVLLIHYCYIHFSERGRKFNKIPGPGLTLPIVGNLLGFVRPTADSVTKLGSSIDNNLLHKEYLFVDQLFDYVHNHMSTYYPIVRIWKLFSDVLISIYDPDDIKVILTSKVDLNKSKLAYESFKEFNFDGIFTSEGEKWKQRRKMIESSFNIPVLKSYINAMNTHAKSVINNINLQGDVTVQNIFPITVKLEFQLVCESLFGFNNSKSRDNLDIDKVEQAYQLGTNYITKRATQLYVPSRLVKLLRGSDIDDCLEMMNKFANTIIDERKEYLEDKQMNKEKKSDDQEYSKSASNMRDDDVVPLIDVLLRNEAKGLIDRTGLIDEVSIMIVGAYKAVGVTIAFSLILLAENKWAQVKAREEVLKVLGTSNDEINYDALQKMDFLERCLKEILRLYPAGPIILRRLSEEKLMSNLSIPAETDVLIDIYCLHRNSRFWSDPNKFDPDRFLPERIKNQHPYSYIPFSSGVRNCPGKKFGYLSLKVAMAQFLRSFHFEPVTRTCDMKFGPTMVLHPVQPAYVKLIKINDFKANSR